MPSLRPISANAVGPDNIISAANCATRLRLVLKESPSAEVTQTDLRDARRHQGHGEAAASTRSSSAPTPRMSTRSTGPAAGSGRHRRCRSGRRSSRGCSTASLRPCRLCLPRSSVHPGCGRPGARRMLIIITHFAPAFANRHLRRAQLYQLDAVHLHAHHDRGNGLQALQVQHLYCHVVLHGAD